MTTKSPPIPAENQSPFGPARKEHTARELGHDNQGPPDPDHRGQTAGIKQNTHNQGYQQDR